MLRISVAPASASSLAGGPGSQMSSQTVSPTRSRSPMSITAPADARLEVALLVEHAVVGQVDLAVDRVHRAVGEHGGRVVDVLGALREADDRDDAVRVGGELAQRRADVGEEVLAQQQVLGRIAGERELGEQHQIRARLLRPRRARRESARRCRRCRRPWRSSDRGRGACQPARSASGRARALKPALALPVGRRCGGVLDLRRSHRVNYEGGASLTQAPKPRSLAALAARRARGARQDGEQGSAPRAQGSLHAHPVERYARARLSDHALPRRIAHA